MKPGTELVVLCILCIRFAAHLFTVFRYWLYLFFLVQAARVQSHLRRSDAKALEMDSDTFVESRDCIRLMPQQK